MAYNLQNTSTPAPGSAFWDFGDGTFSDSVSPTKIYATTGTFTIKMVANFGACKDSISKPITVLATPKVNFSASSSVSCKVPLTVNFVDSSTGGSTYFWDFGDGSTSTSRNPSHIYTLPGTYTVKFFVTNAAGCKDSLVKTDVVSIKPPVVTIKDLPLGACPPLNHTFVAQISPGDAIATYQWDLGDGTTSTLSSPTHTYTNTGSYTITLNYTTTGGCSGVVTVANGIAVGTRPKASFSAIPLNACGSAPIQFTDQSTGNPNNWVWLFGDATSSNLQNPSHQYNDTGNFTVKLIALNNGCADTMTLTDYIHIKPSIAKFTYTSTCALPKQIVFTDQSIGADTWTWNFGDGSPVLSVQNPTHNYALPGNYTVTLTTTNSLTGCSFTKTTPIQIVAEIPGFVSSDSVICKNMVVTFTATNSNPANVVLYTWDFGDGTSASNATNSTTHNYSNVGKYDVTLTIKDIHGCINSITIPQAVNVLGPTAAFRSSLTGVCLNSPATFIDSSITDGVHNIQQWNWNWGDGSSNKFTFPPFTHAYSKPGSYTVTLTVTDSRGCVDSIKVPNAILVSKPIANFVGDSLSCTTSSLNFLNASTGVGLSYSWNFGDGIISNLQNPTHLFTTEGVFSVSLAVKDIYGCTDSVSKINFVTIANPRASFTLPDSTASCPPLIANFNNTSTDFLTSMWDFGDGSTSTSRNPTHFFSSVGTFTTVLTVTGFNGCTSQKTMQIKVNGPTTAFSYSNIIGCKPLQATFKVKTEKTLTLVWDFGDGTALRAPDSVVTHTYTTAGSYLPKMIIVDTTGCSVLINGSDTIKAIGVTASFNNSGTIVCNSGGVQFTNTSVSNDFITNYNWNFGDGTTSTQQNPVHQYTTLGTYATTLNVITQQGCKDTATIPANVKVVTGPKVSISGDTAGCVPALLNFTGNIVIPDTSAVSWNWDFANGNVSTLQNPPSQNYTTAGIYTVMAIGTNSNGCKDTANKSIEIYPLPSLTISPDTTICKGDVAPLSVSGAQSYVWSPATYLSCVNCANPISTPDSSIKYRVQATSNHGCISSDSVALTVKLPFKLSLSKADTLCLGFSVQLNASGTENYTWSPSTGLSSTTIASPVASPTTSVTYQVIGSDSKGCFQDTGYIPVSVFPLPVVNAGPDITINVGGQTNIIPQISNDVTGVLWTPSTGIITHNNPGITVKPTETTEYTILVNNAVGCKARDKVTVFVICNNANVFVPNTFSPNGDGSNDVFYPRGSGVFQIRTLTIFNRWGQIVFQKSNFNANDASAGWDGTLNGKPLSPDVFVYTLEVVCENKATLIFKGNIALIK